MSAHSQSQSHSQFKGSLPFYFGGFIILCMIVIVLLIISPKKNNFFEPGEHYPILNSNLYDTSQYILSEINKQLGIPNKNNKDIPSDHKWFKYPIEEYCNNDIYILPLFMYGKLCRAYTKFPILINIIRNQPNITGVYFWKLPSQSAFIQHKEFNTFDILRCTMCINGILCDESLSSLWVNGEIKKLSCGQYCLWNPNQLFSLHNKTDSDIIYLNIDIKRPKTIPIGIETSSKHIQDKWIKFLKLIE